MTTESGIDIYLHSMKFILISDYVKHTNYTVKAKVISASLLSFNLWCVDTNAIDLLSSCIVFLLMEDFCVIFFLSLLTFPLNLS